MSGTRTISSDEDVSVNDETGTETLETPVSLFAIDCVEVSEYRESSEWEWIFPSVVDLNDEDVSR